MAADLHIHIFTGITEEDLANFNSNCISSKWFKLSVEKDYDKTWERVSKTPNVWVGEVSWLKAALFEDPTKYIPDAVNKISELIGEELPVLSDDLIQQIMQALELPNKTGYSLNTPEKVREFLEAHKGERVFTVSW